MALRCGLKGLFDEPFSPQRKAMNDEAKESRFGPSGQQRTARRVLGVSLIRDDQDKPLHFICQAQDVSAGRQAQNALKESEEKFRRLIETAQEGVWVINADRCTTFVNQRMAGMLGYTVDEMLGAPWLAFTDEEDRAAVAANIERGRSGVTRQHDFKVRRKDGTYMWSLLVANPLFDQEGNYLGALSMLTDISERKQTERALRESEQPFRRIFAVGPAAMVLVSPQGRIFEANDTFARMLGYTKDELLGRSFVDLTHPEDAALDAGLSEKLAAREIPSYQVEKRCLTKGQEIIWINLTASVVCGPADQSWYGLWIVEDITQRKRIERALREAKERFGAAFDNAPIGMALNSTEGRFLQVNRAMCKITGYAEEELLASQVDAITHPDDRDADRAHLEQLLAGQIRSYQMEKRYRHA